MADTKKPIIFAIGCHPDDIEFMMAGTLFLLKEKGCELHYMNIANGSCGTTQYDEEEIIEIRGKEAEQAASYLGAEFHKSIANDMEVLYQQDLIRRVTARIRKIKPDILLVHSPQDYMEDHMNTCRISVTAAFAKGMRNYYTIPHVDPIQKDVTLYHALPHGLTDMLRHRIYPDFYIDISAVIDSKTEMLSHHKSQREWLDSSQGLDSYLRTMRALSEEVGRMSGCFKFAEGWRRHSHLGYSAREVTPLENLLQEHLCDNKKE